MALEDGYFKVGGINSPLPASTSNSLLKDADPVIYYMLQFFAAVLNLHMGSRWNAEVALAGRSDLSNLTVNHKLPYDPVPYLQENQYKFPLLACYRKSETYAELTSAWYNITSNLHIIWIMPPMSAGQMERLAPFMSHVARTIVDRTEQGLDTNYNSGQNVWAASGLSRIRIMSCSYGNIPTETNQYYPTLMMECEMIERRKPATEPGSNYVNLIGWDGYVVSASDGYAAGTVGDFEIDIIEDL